ncbi:MAG: hypothetical protein J2P15_15710 [Micromonosporaceae bacterium]|nr:hypothetical protein [Micromonosporaceae bacterium]
MVAAFAYWLEPAKPAPAVITHARAARPDESMLELSERALLAVISADARYESSVSQVRAGLLEFEAKWWRREPLEQAAGVDLQVEVREQALVALLLFAPVDVDAAVRALRRLPDLTDASVARLRGVVRWAGLLYPPDRGVAPRMEPVALAEQLVVDRLAGNPDLAGCVIADLDHVTDRHTAVKRGVRMT